MNYSLRITEAQHLQLRSHLFPGDGREAVSLLLCGRRVGDDRPIFLVREVVPIPHEVCERRPDRVTWPTDLVDVLLKDATKTEAAILKVHGHGGDYRRFSGTDDSSDLTLFAAIANFLENGLPNASLGARLCRAYDVAADIDHWTLHRYTTTERTGAIRPLVTFCLSGCFSLPQQLGV